MKFGFTAQEFAILRKLNTPRKIQDFLNSLKMNFELGGDTCMSPRMVLLKRKAHCMEAAMLAAAALRLLGYPPLVVDLEAGGGDEDHVIAVFKKHGHWGAISKTNYPCLRYREPVYKTIRELVMSFFHEYFVNATGKKTLRRYSLPVNLSRFDQQEWMTLGGDVWFVPEYLEEVRHYPILTKSQLASLRKVDPIEIQASSLREWKAPRKKS